MFNKIKMEHDECQYLKLIEEILENGSVRDDRTGTGTKSLFGKSMKFDLSNNVIPLFTTKRMFTRGIIEELLWFISGDTNAKTLQEKNVHIWDGNSDRKYLDSRGLFDRAEGDLGPVYGFQWRHFGAEYVDCHTDYTGEGVDQLADLIEGIKTNPNGRRHLLSAWNPKDLSIMALPPCHYSCQFYVDNGSLSCLLNQRSCDMGLGVPFNVFSYSVFTRIIAQVCGLEAKELIYSMGDTHVYLDHIDSVKDQITRVPYEFSTLEINKEITDIDKFTINDFKVVNYKSHPKISMKMSA